MSENEKKTRTVRQGLYNIVVLASGGGGNFKKLIDAQSSSNFFITALIVNKDCGAVSIAKEYGIPFVILNADEPLDENICKYIPQNTDLIVLAGFMPILKERFCNIWKNKIINTHPGLLPKYGGKGMYGVKIQEAVMLNNEEFAGCTIHYVTKDIDEGEIILQKAIKVDYSETPWQLGGRVFDEEGLLLVEAINLIRTTTFKEVDCD